MKSFAPLIAALLTACGAGGTSLDGMLDCGPMTCGSGTVCMTYSNGVDASTGPQGPFFVCVDVRDSCAVEDCSGAQCSPCLIDICSGGADGNGAGVSVEGRLVTCQRG